MFRGLCYHQGANTWQWQARLSWLPRAAASPGGAQRAGGLWWRLPPDPWWAPMRPLLLPLTGWLHAAAQRQRSGCTPALHHCPAHACCAYWHCSGTAAAVALACRTDTGSCMRSNSGCFNLLGYCGFKARPMADRVRAQPVQDILAHDSPCGERALCTLAHNKPTIRSQDGVPKAARAGSSIAGLYPLSRGKPVSPEDIFVPWAPVCCNGPSAHRKVHSNT